MERTQNNELEQRINFIKQIRDEKLKEIEKYQDLPFYEADVKEKAIGQILINYTSCETYLNQIYFGGDRVFYNSGERFGVFCGDDKEDDVYLRKVDHLNQHIERMELVLNILKSDKLKIDEIYRLLVIGNY